MENNSPTLNWDLELRVLLALPHYLLTGPVEVYLGVYQFTKVFTVLQLTQDFGSFAVARYLSSCHNQC